VRQLHIAGFYLIAVLFLFVSLVFGSILYDVRARGGKNVNISKRFRKISFKNKKMMEKKLVREALFTFKVIVSTTTKKKPGLF